MAITTRHAHIATRGPCSLAYAPPTLGRKILTCGSDGLIKMHNLELGRDEEETAENDYFQDGVYAVAASPDGKKIAAGGEAQSVVIFTLPDLEYESIITRGSMAIRDLCYSPNGDYLAVATDDAVIKLVSTDKPEDTKNLEGHSGGVKSVAFDPKGVYLASTGCDRSLRIWDVSSGQEKFKIGDMFSKDAAAALLPEPPATPKNMCKVAWSGLKSYTASAGKLLAVAGSNQVRVFERDTWKELESFPAYGAEISIIEFSPNGKYLLTIDINGELVIWDVEERFSFARRSNSQKILAARWDYQFNTICAIAEDGRWGAWSSAVPDKYPDPSERDLDNASGDEAASEGEIPAPHPSLHTPALLTANVIRA
jgi:chromosome transmission fidelity protein 4